MFKFLKLLFYKFYRFFEKVSKGDESHCAFSAMLFSRVFISINLATVVFIMKRFFLWEFDNLYLKIISFVYFALVFYFAYHFVLNNKVYVKSNFEISNSSLKGTKGNVIILFYISLTIISLVALILYFINYPRAGMN